MLLLLLLPPQGQAAAAMAQAANLEAENARLLKHQEVLQVRYRCIYMYRCLQRYCFC